MTTQTISDFIRYAKLHQLPKKGDVLMPQFFDNIIELRANMEGKTGTGELIATFDPFYFKWHPLSVYREMEFLGLPTHYLQEQIERGFIDPDGE